MKDTNNNKITEEEFMKDIGNGVEMPNTMNFIKQILNKLCCMHEWKSWICDRTKSHKFRCTKCGKVNKITL